MGSLAPLRRFLNFMAIIYARQIEDLISWWSARVAKELNPLAILLYSSNGNRVFWAFIFLSIHWEMVQGNLSSHKMANSFYVRKIIDSISHSHMPAYEQSYWLRKWSEEFSKAKGIKISFWLEIYLWFGWRADIL